MRRQSALLCAGVMAAVAVGAIGRLAGLEPAAAATAAVTTLCAVWWVTEAIPIPATSLLPFALLPLCGVLDHRAVAGAYGHWLILLLLGGFLLSKAVEASGAHERLALAMVRLCGGRGRRGLVLGFMVATAIGSMWLSNTAMALMMLPIATAVCASDDQHELRLPLLLGIAYAASIGGVGTPIGTPPNLVFMANYEELVGERVAFAAWMSWGVPTVCLLVPIAWWLVTRGLPHGAAPRLRARGPWRPVERRVLVVFALTAAAWILRAHPAGGWTGWLGLVDPDGNPLVGDDTVALAAVAVMFVLPDGEGGRALEWDRAREIPWGLLLLFGGGLAIARAFQTSGLAARIGEALEGVSGGPAVLVVGAICLSVTFATELTSNTATTALLMPILGAAALAAGIEPKLLMVPAAISASCAFMMPVATAPNAIVFGTGYVPIRAMCGTGLLLNLAGAVAITAVCVAAL